MDAYANLLAKKRLAEFHYVYLDVMVQKDEEL
jgi:hypothetical protein